MKQMRLRRRKNLSQQVVVALVALGTVWMSNGLASAAEAEDARNVEFFEQQVRPLLARHCYKCHSGKSKSLKGDLRLDSRAGVLEGGESGPAVVVGRPGASLLIQAVRWESLEMPPDGKLTEREVAALVRWIELGAPWAETGQTSSPSDQKEDYQWDKVRNEHWAWRLVVKAVPPTVQSAQWPLNPIDQFVLAKLEAAELPPAPPAEPHILVRRIYLDLIGLPPTPGKVDRFVEAARRDRPAAIAGVVDELLGSPRYGQRWARHWLDVARYSDGYGGFLDNAELTQAWRYRDWVVQAFNRDMPYDKFVKLQIAGDLIGDERNAIATGFFALGPTYHSDGGDPDSVAQAKSETLDDRMDTLGRGFMALTIACARCHEHKFDPIPQQDYYSLAGVFNNTKVSRLPLAAAEVVKAYNDHEREVKGLEKKIRDLANRVRTQKSGATDDQQQQLDRWKTHRDELKDSAPPEYDFAHTLADSGSEDMHVAVRGNLRKPGAIAPRRFLKVVSGPQPPAFSRGSGRIELAEAVAGPENPLTGRVIVNRIWMHHFGKALVRSPSNFGTLGQAPTHPEMLDWLTATFLQSGWSIKDLHRLIMTSAAYQMSSRFDERAFSTDGDNELVWRMNPRRMDVESWRDSLLAVTGELDTTSGGPPVEDITKSTRRTLYAKVSRNGDRFASDEFLRLFDFPLMRATVAKRPTSIVPQQFLFLMNSPFMVERAGALSQRLHREAPADEERIERAYHLLFSRAATDEETRIGMQFLRVVSEGDLSPWQQYAQVLLSSNEFMYIR